MKKILFLFSVLLSTTLMIGVSASAQDQSGVDSTGLPGDNFSLQGALEMFKKSASIEDFEKAINSPDNNINNLDLNEDGKTDYVRVIDKSDNNDHVFVLQVPVSETESQDIAVIELEKTGDASATIQIVGDEDIYGQQVIIEPGGGDDDAFVNSPVSYGGGPNAGFDDFYKGDGGGVVVNVWLWPSVRFVFAPAYRPWISPWRWSYYPGWWRPWRPYAWHVWHPRCVVYHRPYVVVATNRIVRAGAIYRPVRVTSVMVRTHHAAAVNHYRVTRTRTTVTGPRGNTRVRTTTTVRGRHGRVKETRTRVRRR